MRVKKEFGDRLEVDFYDPRTFFFLFTALRHNVRPGEVTWIMNNKVLFRGVPEWDDLKKAIDEELSA